MASKQLLAAVPFYAGLTLEEIGGRGERWQEHDAASAFPAAAAAARDAGGAAGAEAPAEDAADLAGWRSVWDAAEVEHSPALEFLFPRERSAEPLLYAGEERT
jgi:NADH-quinone oxidoreductase subunit G